MESLGDNESLIEKVWYILDSKLTSISIFKKEDIVTAELSFEIPSSKLTGGKRLILSFKNVTQYDFYWNKSYTFYTIERFKFSKNEKGYFISLDPYHESGPLLEEDKGVIIGDHVSGYLN